MQLEALWSLVPKGHVYVYCESRNQFLLTEDRYSEWVMLIVEDGTMKFEIGGKSDTAKAGDIVLCPPDTLFKRKVVAPLSFHYIRFTFADDNGVKSIISKKISLPDNPRLQSTLDFMKNVSDADHSVYNKMMDHLLRDVWFLYCMELLAKTDADKMDTENSQLGEALIYIRAHVYEKMNIKAVAKLVGMTAVQFERRFKREFSVAPKEYVTKLRLKKARSMLVNTKMTLADIAGRCGYDNEYYFSNVFKKHFEIAPSKYRSIHRI